LETIINVPDELSASTFRVEVTTARIGIDFIRKVERLSQRNKKTGLS
jgi:hypothetical protein